MQGITSLAVMLKVSPSSLYVQQDIRTWPILKISQSSNAPRINITCPDNRNKNEWKTVTGSFPVLIPSNILNRNSMVSRAAI